MWENNFEIQVLGLENGENTPEILVLDLSETALASEGQTVGAVSADDSEEASAVVSVDDSTYKSGYEKLPADASFMERLAYGGKVALIGMATVFLVLVIIWALCTVMGKVMGFSSKKKDNDPEDRPIAREDKKPVVTQTASAPVSSVDYTTVAVVASAAIAAYRGEDTVNFNISSIRPCGNGAVALAPEVVAQIAASIACLEGKDEIDFTISSIRII